MSKQLTHNEIENKNNLKEIIVVADNVRTPENVGMLFRVAEGFGVSQVILIGESPNLSNKKVKRTARSTENNLNITTSLSPEETISTLRKENYHLIGLEITNTSTLLKEYDFSNHSKIALFIGNERNGIDSEILNKLDNSVHFDLFGKNSSLNVINALTVGLYEIKR